MPSQAPIKQPEATLSGAARLIQSYRLSKSASNSHPLQSTTLSKELEPSPPPPQTNAQKPQTSSSQLQIINMEQGVPPVDDIDFPSDVSSPLNTPYQQVSTQKIIGRVKERSISKGKEIPSSISSKSHSPRLQSPNSSLGRREDLPSPSTSTQKKKKQYNKVSSSNHQYAHRQPYNNRQIGSQHFRPPKHEKVSKSTPNSSLGGKSSQAPSPQGLNQLHYESSATMVDKSTSEGTTRQAPSPRSNWTESSPRRSEEPSRLARSSGRSSLRGTPLSPNVPSSKGSRTFSDASSSGVLANTSSGSQTGSVFQHGSLSTTGGSSSEGSNLRVSSPLCSPVSEVGGVQFCKESQGEGGDLTNKRGAASGGDKSCKGTLHGDDKIGLPMIEEDMGGGLQQGQKEGAKQGGGSHLIFNQTHAGLLQEKAQELQGSMMSSNSGQGGKQEHRQSELERESQVRDITSSSPFVNYSPHQIYNNEHQQAKHANPKGVQEQMNGSYGDSRGFKGKQSASDPPPTVAQSIIWFFNCCVRPQTAGQYNHRKQISKKSFEYSQKVLTDIAGPKIEPTTSEQLSSQHLSSNTLELLNDCQCSQLQEQQQVQDRIIAQQESLHGEELADQMDLNQVVEQKSGVQSTSYADHDYITHLDQKEHDSISTVSKRKSNSKQHRSTLQQTTSRRKVSSLQQVKPIKSANLGAKHVTKRYDRRAKIFDPFNSKLDPRVSHGRRSSKVKWISKIESGSVKQKNVPVVRKGKALQQQDESPIHTSMPSHSSQHQPKHNNSSNTAKYKNKQHFPASTSSSASPTNPLDIVTQVKISRSRSQPSVGELLKSTTAEITQQPSSKGVQYTHPTTPSVKKGQSVEDTLLVRKASNASLPQSPKIPSKNGMRSSISSQASSLDVQSPQSSSEEPQACQAGLEINGSLGHKTQSNQKNIIHQNETVQTTHTQKHFHLPKQNSTESISTHYRYSVPNTVGSQQVGETKQSDLVEVKNPNGQTHPDITQQGGQNGGSQLKHHDIAAGVADHDPTKHAHNLRCASSSAPDSFNDHSKPGRLPTYRTSVRLDSLIREYGKQEMQLQSQRSEGDTRGQMLKSSLGRCSGRLSTSNLRQVTARRDKWAAMAFGSEDVKRLVMNGQFLPCSSYQIKLKV